MGPLAMRRLYETISLLIERKVNGKIPKEFTNFLEIS